MARKYRLLSRMSSLRAVEQWGLSTSAILKTWFYLFYFICHPVVFHDECLLRDYMLQFLVQILMTLARATKAVGQYRICWCWWLQSRASRAEGTKQLKGTVAALNIGRAPFTHPFISSVHKYSRELSTRSCSWLKLYSWMEKQQFLLWLGEGNWQKLKY